MTTDNPLQRLLDQLSDLLQTAEAASHTNITGQTPPPADIQLRVKQLEQAVQKFKEQTDKQLAQTGLSEEQVQKLSQVIPEGLPKQDRLFLERTRQLAKDARRGYNALSFGINQVKRKLKAPAVRKKKFDRLGARKKWKPM